MVKSGCPCFVIAGTASGVGKTSLALGLVRELSRRGLRVQTFKVGPDFLDPTHLAVASGRTCYNLDGWMTDRAYVEQLVARTTADADLAIIEGVMGLFDGASPTTLAGSTAEIAAWLDALVLLVVSAHGAARSLAATVKGFAEFEPSVRIAGVIANQGGSVRHRAWLAESLAAAGLPPLLGLVPRGTLPELPSRHLGLVTADAESLNAGVLDQLADAVRAEVDVDTVVQKAEGGRGNVEGSTEYRVRSTEYEVLNKECGVRSMECGGESTSHSLLRTPYSVLRTHNPPSFRIGLAADAAFHFYYPDNLEAFTRRGVQWCRFSPLADAHLPDGLDGLYLGGGYPEVFAARLSDNQSLLEEVRDFAASGRPVYAECGGLMYLGRAITTLDGMRHPMAGVLPIDTAMLPRLKTLGYAEAALCADGLWGPSGTVCRGHEFHYSEITASDAAAEGWQPAYSVHRRRGEPGLEGLTRGNVLASYVHLHWASRPALVDAFLSRCKVHA